MKTLVIGLGGTGKTTWVKRNLGDGLCFDLDALAFAMRLEPYDAEKTRRIPDAIACANNFLTPFLDYTEFLERDVFIIRTAPSIGELEVIEPERLIVCSRVYVNRGYGNEKAASLRIQRAIAWAKERFINVECL